MKATSDPDTMYFHEAMREEDKAEFLKAMQKEWDDQMGNGNLLDYPPIGSSRGSESTPSGLANETQEGH
jgi:hypothetical protein